jgi:RNA polymerase sigma-70 factor (ECF subfamily)
MRDPEDSAMTSPTLLALVGSNPQNNDAWRVFLARYHPLIRTWCLRAGLQDQDAEEVSAAVVVKLFQEMPKFVYNPERRFRGWLKTMVDNQLRDFWRRVDRHPADWGSGDSGVHRLLEEQAAPATEDLVEQMAADLEAAQAVIRAVRQRVSTTTWEAFQRTALGQEPAAAVARDLGLKVGTVYEAKHRVSQLLRKEGQKQSSRDAE